LNPQRTNVNSVLAKSDHCLVIPPYQRPYEWNRIRWQGLVKDIAQLLDANLKEQHFIGVVITAQDQPNCNYAKDGYLHAHTDLIDGQQRVITLRVWLQAIIDHATELGEPPVTDTLGFANLQVQETDSSEWKEIRSGSWKKNYRNYKNDESGLLHAYTYFRWILWLGIDALLEYEPEVLPRIGNVNTFNPDLLYDLWDQSLEKRALSNSSSSGGESLQIARSPAPDWKSLISITLHRLYLVVIQRESSDEDAAELFNALNGQRTELQEFDHIRNFIFSNLKDLNERNGLYSNIWKTAEQAVARENIPSRGSSPFDTFTYDYLISIGEKRFQKQISKDKTALHFVRYFNSSRVGKKSAFELAKKEVIPHLISWAVVKKLGEDFYVGEKKYSLSKKAKNSLKLMEWLSSGPVTPLLLHLVHEHLFGKMTQIELQRGFSSIENFLARTVISGRPLSPMRATVMEICSQLGKSWSVNELIRILDANKPKDSDLKRILLPKKATYPYEESGEVYQRIKSRQILAIFQGIESELSGELTNLLIDDLDDALSIDHIYPQKPERWKSDLKNWGQSSDAMHKRLHTLGNLAVVPKKLNKGMSNKRFEGKRETLKTHKFVKLRVNDSWLKGTTKIWSPEQIDARAGKLLDAFIQHWPQKSGI